MLKNLFVLVGLVVITGCSSTSDITYDTSSFNTYVEETGFSGASKNKKHTDIAPLYISPELNYEEYCSLYEGSLYYIDIRKVLNRSEFVQSLEKEFYLNDKMYQEMKEINSKLHARYLESFKFDPNNHKVLSKLINDGNWSVDKISKIKSEEAERINQSLVSKYRSYSKASGIDKTIVTSRDIRWPKKMTCSNIPDFTDDLISILDDEK